MSQSGRQTLPIEPRISRHSEERETERNDVEWDVHWKNGRKTWRLLNHGQDVAYDACVKLKVRAYVTWSPGYS